MYIVKEDLNHMLNHDSNETTAMKTSQNIVEEVKQAPSSRKSGKPDLSDP